MSIEFVTGDPGHGPCEGCGKTDELRMGFCFDCATEGEWRAAHRTVEQHLETALRNLKAGRKLDAETDIKWAYERLTETGDYTFGGYFDQECPSWRNESLDQ